MMRYLLILSVLFFAACSDDEPDLNPIGEACEVGTDCEGEVCLLEHPGFFEPLVYPGGYCTNTECNSSNLGLDCDEGVGMCLVANASQSYDCYLQCATNEDCPREEYSCLVFQDGRGACVPTAVIPKGHVAPAPANFSNK